MKHFSKKWVSVFRQDIVSARENPKRVKRGKDER